MNSRLKVSGLGVVLVALHAAAAPPELADANRFDVTKLSMSSMQCPDAIPDDGLDDSDAFSCAMSYFQDKPGVLHVPVGVFDVSKAILVPSKTQLVGDGMGSVLHQVQREDGYWKSNPMISLDARTILRDLELDQDQPLPQGGRFTPDDRYDFIVRAVRQDILIEDVVILKAYKGIAVGVQDDTVGRVVLRNIRGQPLAFGIVLDNVWDVARVEDVHFWPFWSDRLDCSGNCSGNGSAVSDWVQNNGVAVVTQRNDNPFFQNLFFLGYATGIRFEDGGHGVTQKAKITHFDCDFCGIGIDMAASGSRDNVVASMSYLGAAQLDFRVPLQVQGSSSSISVSEAAVDGVSDWAVVVSGKNSFVRVSQWLVRRWNQANRNATCFLDIGGLNKLWVRESYGRWGNGGPLCGSTQSCEFTLGQPL